MNGRRKKEGKYSVRLREGGWKERKLVREGKEKEEGTEKMSQMETTYMKDETGTRLLRGMRRK